MGDCPDDVTVQAGVPFTWHTDGSVQRTGFHICMAGPPTDDECDAINADVHADPICEDTSCSLECALSHATAMNACVDNFPDPSFRQTCQNVVDALVDGTSTRSPSSDSSCFFSGDGECDEPAQCAFGTDADCAPVEANGSRSSNVCTTYDACPATSNPERVRALWTEMLYYDADNNLEQFNVGTLNGLSAQALGGIVKVTDGVGEPRAAGEYVPLLAAHKELAGSEVFAQQDSAGSYTGLAIFVSHTADGIRAWVLADLGPLLNDITASVLYSVESNAARPPTSGWSSVTGDGPAPTLTTTAIGPASCVGDYLNLVVLVDRCREDTSGCDSDDHHEIIGIVDADGNSVRGIFTGAKRLQLLPPDAAGRWLDLDANMQPLHSGNVATDPEPDVSRGDTLAQFVRAAMAAYPADYYFLELSDHGGAWYGAIQDFDNAQMDNGQLSIMDIATMQSALHAALDADQKIDIISFDACLMASQTVAAALAPYARYLIASQLSIMVSPDISDPWNHRAHVPYSAEGPQAAEEYAVDVVDHFVDCGGVDTMQTMSLVSLDDYPAFSQAMADVAAILTAAVDPSSDSRDLVVTALQVVNNLDGDYGELGGHDNDMGDCESCASTENIYELLQFMRSFTDDLSVAHMNWTWRRRS